MQLAKKLFLRALQSGSRDISFATMARIRDWRPRRGKKFFSFPQRSNWDSSGHIFTGYLGDNFSGVK
jgi:hypothetical protein